MIRPIDMQMLLPRTESVGNMQQHENQSVVNANLNAANQVEKEQRQNRESVIKKEDAEFDEYQYDAREEGKGNYSNPRRNRKKKDTSKKQFEVSDGTVEEMNDKQPRINIQI